jgi:hypothetical protein
MSYATSMIFLLLFAFQLHAQDAAKSPTVIQSEAASTTTEVDGLQLRLAFLFPYELCELNGSGFTASTESDLGSGLQLGLTYPLQDMLVLFEYQSTEVDVSSPNGLSPIDMKSEVVRISLGYKQDLNSEFLGRLLGSQLSYYLGVESKTRDSTKTSPNAALSSSNQFGFNLGVSKLYDIKKKWALEFYLGLFVPLFYEEGSTSTGSYKFSVNPEINFHFIYEVNDFIDFMSGFDWHMDRVYFSGTGSRGSESAEEVFNTFDFILQLRFQF